MSSAASTPDVDRPPPPDRPDWDAFAESVGIPPADRAKWAASIDPAKRGPRLLLLWVPEDKVAENRLHLDVNVDTLPAGEERTAAVREHAERRVAAGATLVEERHDNLSW